MEKQNKTIQKIESHYIGHDCIQIMLPYQETLTVLNQDGILYHHNPESNIYINKYLDDERRKQFPYSNIPTHFSKFRSQKIAFTNQLLDFEKPYIINRDGLLYENFVVKDNNQALMISYKILPTYHVEHMLYDEFFIALPDNYQIKHMTYDELLKYINKQNLNEEVYYLYLSGNMPSNNKELFPNEEVIHAYIKKELSKNIRDLQEKFAEENTNFRKYLEGNPLFLNYLNSTIGNIDFSSMNFNIDIYDALIVMRVNKGKISLQIIEIKYIKDNDFKVFIYDIPVTKYNLEQLKNIHKINTSKEPKIPLRFNPNITKQDIKEAKKMVKALRK